MSDTAPQAHGHGRREGNGPGASLPAAANASSYSALADAINEQIELEYHCPVALLQYPSQGNFPWYYENANQVFNAATFDYLSARVTPGDAPGLAKLSPAGGFPNAYAQVLADLTWTGTAPSQARLVAGLLANTTGPGATNGGMQTVDPDTGAVSPSWQVGYAVNTPLADIQSALADPDRCLAVTIDAAGGESVHIDYPGYTMVSASPAAWQQGTGIGWFYPDPIAQAFQNAGTDLPGFRFTNPPPFQPGPPAAGGDLGWITSLLVCATPRWTVSPPAGHPAAGAGISPANDVLAGLSLLGLPPPTSSAASRIPIPIPKRRARSARTGLNADYRPGVPVLQQTAYVIGAVLGFPP